MNTIAYKPQGKEDDLLTVFLNKFFPYWPLFVALFLVAIVAAWGYLKFATPMYSASATLIIKDENKGVDESRMTESINAFASKKIVENEIEVIQSRALMRKVVADLHLYAPLYEEHKFKNISAYHSSPIIVQLKNPNQVVPMPDGQEKIYFELDRTTNTVLMANSAYPLDSLVKTPFGEMQFKLNPNHTATTEFPLFFELKPLGSVTSSLLGRLEVSSANKLSTVVNLELVDEVPQRAEDVLNHLIHHYNMAAVYERTNLAANTLMFIEDRMTLVEKELDDLEKQVQKYTSSKGIVDLSEQGRVFLQNASENDRKLADINIQLAVLEKVEDYIISKKKSAGIVPSTLGINDPVLTQLLQKLYDNEMQYQRLSKTTAENNPIMFSLRNEVESIRPSILENIQNQRDNLLASKAKLTSTQGGFNSVLQSIPQKERELLEISRQQTIKNEIYSFLLQKREETALSYAPSAGDSKLVDKAEAFGPVSPNGKIIYLASFAFSFLLGLTLITAKDLLTSKILYRSDIEDYTHTPIVAELANVKNKKGQRYEAPDNPVVIEQFRQLRTSLGLYSRAFHKKKLMVTSSIPGEGKSFVSANLAYSLASSGKRVVLIDLDTRNPKTSAQFGFLHEVGITDYLVEQDIIEVPVRPTSIPNFNILPAGTKIGDHTEALLNGRLEYVFEVLERSFDYIIVDTSPIDYVSDGYLISEFCDISLLIIRHAHTPKSVIKYLEASNKAKSLKNLAIVFNGLRSRGFVTSGHGYGYGYGYPNRARLKAY
jgi:tyrosine-protein kinase Etk/Wzc